MCLRPSGLKKFQDLEIFKRAWNFQASHPPYLYLLWGFLEVRIEKFQARLKFSSEIENFKRSWNFSSFGPLGETIRENQAIRANLRLDSRESGHLSSSYSCFSGVRGTFRIFYHFPRARDPQNFPFGKPYLCPAKMRGFFDKKRRKWRIYVLATKTRVLLLKPSEENDENGGCHAGKGMAYQRHRFLFPEFRGTSGRLALWPPPSDRDWSVVWTHADL